MLHPSRRAFLLAAPLAVSAADESFTPVIGLHSNTLRGQSVDDVIAAMHSAGLNVLELSLSHLEPHTGDLRPIREIRQKFADARILIYALAASLRPEQPDEEIRHIISIANTLDARCLTTPCSPEFLPRLERIARKQSLPIAIHNEGSGTISSQTQIRATLQNYPSAGLALDLGNAAAENLDSIQILRENLRQIRIVHLKDRRPAGGEEVPLGQGSADVKGVLRLFRVRRIRVPLMLELVYRTPDPLREIRSALNYCRRISRPAEEQKKD